MHVKNSKVLFHRRTETFSSGINGHVERTAWRSGRGRCNNNILKTFEQGHRQRRFRGIWVEQSQKMRLAWMAILVSMEELARFLCCPTFAETHIDTEAHILYNQAILSYSNPLITTILLPSLKFCPVHRDQASNWRKMILLNVKREISVPVNYWCWIQCILKIKLSSLSFFCTVLFLLSPSPGL